MLTVGLLAATALTGCNEKAKGDCGREGPTRGTTATVILGGIVKGSAVEHTVRSNARTASKTVQITVFARSNVAPGAEGRKIVFK